MTHKQITITEHAPALSPQERERARLQEIQALGLLDGGRDEALQALVREVCEAFALPVALVSIVLDGAQFFAASHGLGGWLAQAGGTPVEWAFCRIAVRDARPFIVEDAAVHPHVCDSPLVTQDGVRCYIGIPLCTSRGHVIGTLCTLGADSRAFTTDERERLEAMAARAIRRIEARAGRETDAEAADAEG